MARLRRFIVSPVTATVLTMLLVAMSLLGQEHFQWAVICGAVLIILTFMSKYFERQEKNALLRTWPGRNLWEVLDDAYRSLRRADSAALRSPATYREDGKNEAIREALRALVRLTFAFDERPAGDRIGANIMLYRPRSDIPAGETDAVQMRLKPRAEKLEALAGVLDLQLHLSVCGTGVGKLQAPDPELKPLALAVPTNWFSAQNLKLVIPGAAEAFVVPKGYFMASDTLTLAQRREGYSLPDHVWTEIDAYYRDIASAGQKVRSFISVVVLDPLKPAGAGDRLAVLNIHSSLTGLFSDESAFIAFKNFLAPILMDIGELLHVEK